MSHRSREMRRVAWLFLACVGARAQGPVVTPAVLPTFTYTMNSGGFPAAQTLKVTLPAAISTLPVSVTNIQAASVICGGTPPCGWLAVTPDLGNVPLTLSVSVNPTGLTPGNYAGSFLVDTVPSSGKQAVTVIVNLQISNPPSALMISSSALNFTYTTGSSQSTLAWYEVDVSSTGDLIPFNVTVANSKSGSSGSGTTAAWLRVSSVSPTQGAALTTSGSAGVGSLVPIFVTVDYATLQGLGIGQYNATVTVTPATSNSKLNVSQTVAVGLVVSAGAPTVSSVFPQSVIPALPTDPVFTIYGSNFTANTSVFLDAFIGLPIETKTQITSAQLTLVSPKILQAKVPAASLYALPSGYTYPYTCVLRIQNGGFPEVDVSFTVTDPSAPSISLIVNAASYQQISKFVGSAGDPATTPATNPPTAISPRGAISIFGQNLGPSVVSTASPNPAVTASCPTGNCYATTWGTMQIKVGFTFHDPTLTTPGPRTVYAPILMTSINQINVIVPWEVAHTLLTNKSATATVQVWSGATASQPPYPVTVIDAEFRHHVQQRAAILRDLTGQLLQAALGRPAPA